MRTINGLKKALAAAERRLEAAADRREEAIGKLVDAEIKYGVAIVDCDQLEEKIKAAEGGMQGVATGAMH